MRLIAAINTGLDADLAVRALFEAPTVAAVGAPNRWDGGGLEPLVAGRAARGGSVVVCPEPVVVPRPVAGALTGLQHGGGVAAERATWMPTRWVRRWPMWWAATRACARCSLAPDGIPQQVVVPAERAEFGWQVIDATGWPAGPAG